jgi:hypothetical protein
LCFMWGTNWIYICYVNYIDVIRPSLEILTLCTANYLFLSWSNLTFCNH